MYRVDVLWFSSILYDNYLSASNWIVNVPTLMPLSRGVYVVLPTDLSNTYSLPVKAGGVLFRRNFCRNPERAPQEISEEGWKTLCGVPERTSRVRKYSLRNPKWNSWSVSEKNPWGTSNGIPVEILKEASGRIPERAYQKEFPEESQKEFSEIISGGFRSSWKEILYKSKKEFVDVQEPCKRLLEQFQKQLLGKYF